MSRYYPSKGPYLMPSTDPNIWPTHTPSAKPSNIQSFFHYGIMAYVPCGYLFKYTKVFPSFSQSFTPSDITISQYSCSLFHTLQPTTSTNTKISHYIIFFQYLLYIFYVINISKRVSSCTQSLVPLNSGSFTSLTNSCSVPYFTSPVESNFKQKLYNQN